MSISVIDGTCAFLCRSVGAGRYWKAEGSDPRGVGWVVLVSSSSRHQFSTIPLVSSMVLFSFSAFPPSSAEWLRWFWLSPSNLGGRVIFSWSPIHGLVRIRDWGGGSVGVGMSCCVGVRRWVFSGKAL